MKRNRKLIKAATHMNISPLTGEITSYSKPLNNYLSSTYVGVYGNLFFSPEFERLVKNMDVMHRMFFLLCKSLMIGNNSINLKTKEIAQKLERSERQVLRAKKQLIALGVIVDGQFNNEISANIFCKGNKEKIADVRRNQKKASTNKIDDVIKKVRSQSDRKTD